MISRDFFFSRRRDFLVFPQRAVVLHVQSEFTKNNETEYAICLCKMFSWIFQKIEKPIFHSVLKLISRKNYLFFLLFFYSHGKKVACFTDFSINSMKFLHTIYTFIEFWFHEKFPKIFFFCFSALWYSVLNHLSTFVSIWILQTLDSLKSLKINVEINVNNRTWMKLKCKKIPCFAFSSEFIFELESSLFHVWWKTSRDFAHCYIVMDLCYLLFLAFSEENQSYFTLLTTDLGRLFDSSTRLEFGY